MVMVCLLLISAPADSMTTIKRHLVLYGGFDDAAIETIVENADILVVGRIRGDQLLKLKKMKPDMIVLKYQHALSVPRATSHWKTASRSPAWFATDRHTNERLVQDRYGWYLMNISSEQWRNFQVANIADGTETSFDGIFLDDFWDHYVAKFVTEKRRRPGDPPLSMIHNWQPSMIQFLLALRNRYSKLIFINGAHECYISYVDGVMDESFVHANWHSESYFHPRANDLRSISKIDKLSKYNKPILVQSGSSGAQPGSIDAVFRYCLLSYLLVANEQTYFNFHPAHTYHYRKMYFHPLLKLTLGAPSTPHYVYRDQTLHPNMLENGSFDENMNRWRTRAGSPMLDSNEALKDKSVRFEAMDGKRDMLTSDFLPVAAGRQYTMSAYCKSKRNIPGSANYKRLGMQGRFFDGAKRRIPGAFDLKFGAGTYDWQYYETAFESPPGAAYFQIRVGFIGDGIGTGWVDNIYFGRTAFSDLVFRRDFAGGSVFVNMGNHQATFSFDGKSEPDADRTVTIDPRSGYLWEADR